MWLKPAVIIIIFYILAVLQNSFFAPFNIFGAVPNLVFVFFFLLLFFEQKNVYWQILFFSVCGGLFIDLFSARFLGVSVFFLLITGLAAKKTQLSLKEQKDVYPPAHFFPLFMGSLILYDALSMTIALDAAFIAGLIYNLVFAGAGFWFFKKFLAGSFENRQLSLFSKH